MCIDEHELLGLFEAVNAKENAVYVSGVSADTWTNLSIPFGFVPRDECENDDTFKQMIPYIIVKHGGRYLTYSRTDQSGEKRLVGKKSIGIGGHINQSDLPEGSTQLDAIIRNCIIREVKEELGVDLPTGRFFVSGILYKPTDDVSRKHFGVVAQAYIAPDAICQPENTMTRLEWKPTLELFRTRNEYETWSKYLIEHLMANEGL